jgi:hypothetical protein
MWAGALAVDDVRAALVGGGGAGVEIFGKAVIAARVSA